MARTNTNTFPGGLTEKQYHEAMKAIDKLRRQAVETAANAPRGADIRQPVRSLFDAAA